MFWLLEAYFSAARDGESSNFSPTIFVHGQAFTLFDLRSSKVAAMPSHITRCRPSIKRQLQFPNACDHDLIMRSCWQTG